MIGLEQTLKHFEGMAGSETDVNKDYEAAPAALPKSLRDYSHSCVENALSDDFTLDFDTPILFFNMSER